MHPDPAGLMWRHYYDDHLSGTAVYAGFSKDAEVVGLFLMSRDGVSPITARDLGKVSIARMRRRWRNQRATANQTIAGLLGLQRDEDAQAATSVLLERAADLRNMKRPGQAGHPDRYYADIAVRYARLVLTVRHPNKSLAAELGGITPKSAKSLVYAARKKGFLTPTTAGRGGGDATAKAVAALAENRDR